MIVSLSLSLMLAAAVFPADPREVPLGPDDPARYWRFEELARTPAYRPAGFPDSEAEGMRALMVTGKGPGNSTAEFFCYYAVPEGEMPSGGWPGVVLVHGGGGTAFPNYVKEWRSLGFAVIAPDWYNSRPAPGSTNAPPRKGSVPRIPLEGGKRQDHVANVANMVLAHSLLRSFPEVNAGRTVFVGLSWGSWYGGCVAAVDGRFRGCVEIYCGDLWPNVRKGRELVNGRFLHAAKVPMWWAVSTNDANVTPDSLNDGFASCGRWDGVSVVNKLPHSHVGFQFPCVHRMARYYTGTGKRLPRLGMPRLEGNELVARVLDAGGGIDRVKIGYTTDGSSPFVKRLWKYADGVLVGDTVRARLPEGTVICYLAAFEKGESRFGDLCGTTPFFNVPPPSSPGVTFRFDDARPAGRWRELAALFDARGLKATFAINAGYITDDEQKKFLREAVTNGHEIIDHTHDHSLFSCRYRNREEYLRHADDPVVADRLPDAMRLNLSYGFDSAHPANFSFRGFVTNGILVVTSVPGERFRRPAKIYCPKLDRMFGFFNSPDGHLKLRSFWTTAEASVPDMKESEFLCVSSKAFRFSDDVLRFQARRSRDAFHRLGLPFPRSWAQPGGWDPRLDDEAFRRIYADEFGYVLGDASVPYGEKGKPEKAPYHVSYRSYFDNPSVTGESIRRDILAARKAGKNLAFISHMNQPKGMTREAWLAETASLLDWLKERNIPVLTASRLGLQLAGRDPAGETAVLARSGATDYRLVIGTNRFDKIAADELTEIFEKGTGVRLSGKGGRAIYVGRCPEAEAAFGADRIDSLRDEETLVGARGGSFFIVGGGDLGTLYAVYDFAEKCFGYKLYGMYPEAEIVNRVQTLRWDGRDVSSVPKFHFYRTDFTYPKSDEGLSSKFMLRNRNNECFTRYGKNILDYRPENFRAMGAQHGSFNFVPVNDVKAGIGWFKRPFLKGMFKEHPEYFSLDSKGKRAKNKQVCFSNPDLRRLFTARFREIAVLNGPGIYCVGQNDMGNDIYCYCDGCRRLAAKYRTNAGPQWDYILELCEAIRDMPGVKVLSLAYKRNEQSEIAPHGVTFPDNFICDMACLNVERPPSRMPDIKCADGSIFNRSANIAQWMKIIKTPMTYWYYSAATPVQTYRRMQEEFKEVYAAGMRGIGACGAGGGVEFADVSEYMFFRLARDPHIDADREVLEIFSHKYGAAAEAMFAYLKELEAVTEKYLAKSVDQAWGSGDSYDQMSHLDAKDIVRWQGMFDVMEKTVADSPRHLRNVKIARLGPDCWTIVFASRIRAEVPEYRIDASAILKRAYAACDAAEAAGMTTAKRNHARRVLEGFKFYATLKSDALPPELAGENPAKVFLCLPVDVRDVWKNAVPPVEDSLAAAGVAGAAPWTAKDAEGGKVGFTLYDTQTKGWVFTAAKNNIPVADVPTDRYAVFKAGTGYLPKRPFFVVGGKWGTALDVRYLGRYFDPSYDDRIYDYYVSLRMADGQLRFDRIYLVLRSRL